MRHKIATVLVGGVLGLTGVTLAAPALAAVGANGAATAVDDRVSKIKAALSGLVTDKTLTQAQADKVAQTLADAKVGGPGPGGFGPRHGMRGMPGMRGGHGPHDLAAAASALGMTKAELRAALTSGKSLAAVAKEKGVSVTTLVDKLVAAAKTRIAQEVKDGDLTQAQADQMLTTLKDRITDRVNDVRPARPDHRPGDGDKRMTPDATPNATPGSYTPSA